MVEYNTASPTHNAGLTFFNSVDAPPNIDNSTTTDRMHQEKNEALASSKTSTRQGYCVVYIRQQRLQIYNRVGHRLEFASDVRYDCKFRERSAEEFELERAYGKIQTSRSKESH